jgi:hypothetical protein
VDELHTGDEAASKAAALLLVEKRAGGKRPNGHELEHILKTR